MQKIESVQIESPTYFKCKNNQSQIQPDSQIELFEHKKSSSYIG